MSKQAVNVMVTTDILSVLFRIEGTTPAQAARTVLQYSRAAISNGDSANNWGKVFTDLASFFLLSKGDSVLAGDFVPGHSFGIDLDPQARTAAFSWSYAATAAQLDEVEAIELGNLPAFAKWVEGCSDDASQWASAYAKVAAQVAPAAPAAAKPEKPATANDRAPQVGKAKPAAKVAPAPVPKAAAPIANERLQAVKATMRAALLAVAKTEKKAA